MYMEGKYRSRLQSVKVEQQDTSDLIGGKRSGGCKYRSREMGKITIRMSGKAKRNRLIN